MTQQRLGQKPARNPGVRRHIGGAYPAMLAINSWAFMG